ncbi:MAG TPA: hypothetical protein VMJ31_01130 [Methylocystis sp.]|nr:hypothetical protein [Methylocystis sp.]
MLQPFSLLAAGGARRGTHIDLLWEVIVLRPILELLAPVLRPAFAWSHRWTTPRGEKGLREYLAARGANAAN